MLSDNDILKRMMNYFNNQDEKLNVKYVFNGRSIDDYSEDNITVKKIYNNYEYNVHKLEKAQ